MQAVANQYEKHSFKKLSKKQMLICSTRLKIPTQHSSLHSQLSSVNDNICWVSASNAIAYDSGVPQMYSDIFITSCLKVIAQ